MFFPSLHPHHRRRRRRRHRHRRRHHHHHHHRPTIYSVGYKDQEMTPKRVHLASNWKQRLSIVGPLALPLFSAICGATNEWGFIFYEFFRSLLRFFIFWNAMERDAFPFCWKWCGGDFPNEWQNGAQCQLNLCEFCFMSLLLLLLVVDVCCCCCCCLSFVVVVVVVVVVIYF